MATALKTKPASRCIRVCAAAPVRFAPEDPDREGRCCVDAADEPRETLDYWVASDSLATLGMWG